MNYYGTVNIYALVHTALVRLDYSMGLHRPTCTVGPHLRMHGNVTIRLFQNLHLLLDEAIRYSDNIDELMEPKTADAAYRGASRRVLERITAGVSVGKARRLWAEGYRCAVSELTTRDSSIKSLVRDVVEQLDETHLEQILGLELVEALG